MRRISIIYVLLLSCNVPVDKPGKVQQYEIIKTTDKKLRSYTDSLVEYHDNGTIKEVVQMRSGKKNGHSRLYFDDGGLSGIYKYVDGVKSGEFSTFYDNGKIRSRGFLLNDSTMHGALHLYDIDGNHMRTMHFARGKMVD